jgi:hypothetical protein
VSAAKRTMLTALGAAVAAAVAIGGLTVGNAQAATTQLCASQVAAVAAGAYNVQNNEWGSTAPECITTDGNADFSVANSSISNSTSGAPGGYPSVYRGCHWGNCTPNSGFPIQVSAMHSGLVTSSWNTTQTGSGAYDVAYDIWFNQASTTAGQPNGAELMVWINHNGPPQPFGSKVATTTVDGVSYDVWFGNQGWNTISYVRTSGTTSVSNMDIDDLTSDAISRGYIQPAWFLIDVEAGFELWQGGAGLGTNSFSVSTNGSGGPPPTTTPPTTNPPTTTPPTTNPPPTTQPGGGPTCKVVYTVGNSWAGGFQAQIVLSNTGTTATHGWALDWTFPGDQKISNLWGGTATQTGANVHVTNASYDGGIAPASSVTFGFTATSSSSNNTPGTITCTAN